MLALDRTHVALYRDATVKARRVSAGRTGIDVRVEENKFRASRNACGRNPGCLRSAYDAGNAVMQRFVTTLDKL